MPGAWRTVSAGPNRSAWPGLIGVRGHWPWGWVSRSAAASGTLLVSCPPPAGGRDAPCGHVAAAADPAVATENAPATAMAMALERLQ